MQINVNPARWVNVRRVSFAVSFLLYACGARRFRTHAKIMQVREGSGRVLTQRAVLKSGGFSSAFFFGDMSHCSCGLRTRCALGQRAESKFGGLTVCKVRWRAVSLRRVSLTLIAACFVDRGDDS
jgi:hypothetical protein